MNKFIALLLPVILWSAPSHGQVKFGDWAVVDASDNSKEFFGYRCFIASQSCLYIVYPDIGCKEGDSYAILMNTSAGAAQLSGRCIKETTSLGSGLVISPYKSMEDAINQAEGVIGFAIPLASGRFKAVRFSLNGAKMARDSTDLLTRSRSKSRSQSKPNSGTF